MKFVYFYSPLYEFYSKRITENLSSYFDLKPIFINDINNDKGGHTFWGGNSIKIELIIQEIKENIGNFIVFSDATIFINANNASSLKEFIDKYTNYDLCFADNAINDKYNIGFILIKCNDITLSFFQNVLFDLKKFKGWDQEIVNEHIFNSKYNLNISKFDKSMILCGYDFDTTLKNTYLIYKSFIPHDSNIFINFNRRLSNLKHYQLIDLKTYNDNVKPL